MPAWRRSPARHLVAVLLTLFAASPSAAMDACPWRFTVPSGGVSSACVFVGRYNAACGGEALAVIAGDGTALVVGVSSADTSSPIYLPAQALGPSEGRLVFWHERLELATARSAGTVRMEAGGARLRIAIAGGSLYAGDCRFEEFVGRFVGLAGAPGGPEPMVSELGHSPRLR